MKIGIIGGSGLYDVSGLEYIKDIKLQNIYGDPSGEYKLFYYKGLEIFFLPRHGNNHSIPPHKVNYRANIDGFNQLGVSKIISFTATGGINKTFLPGDIVVSSNAIDFTNGRQSTFFDEGDIYHIDFTNPFCPSLRKGIIDFLTHSNLRYHPKGTYICTNGPRLETSAEIDMFNIWGADLVGMTLFPEATLSREKEICYSNISIITNFAAGTTNEKLTAEDVVKVISDSKEKIISIISNIDKIISTECKCCCSEALNNNKISK